MKNPSDVANKWANGLAGAGSSIEKGVRAVTQNPAEKAAQRQDAWLAGVNRAASNGKYQRGLRRVTLQAWQDAMIQKGLPRIASGASQAKGKFEQFMSKWLPHQEALKQKLSSMPRGDLQQNIARMVAAVQHNASFEYNT
jgi:hypothetical protein